MSKKTINVIVILMVVIAMIFSLIACADKAENTTETTAKKTTKAETTKSETTKGETTKEETTKEETTVEETTVEETTVQETVPISFLLHRAANIEFPEENQTRDIISETLNIEFNPIMVLEADMATIRATKIASGDLPDIMNVDLSDISNLATTNVIIPLDELLTSAANIAEKYNTEDFGSCKFEGDIYAIPSKSPWVRVVSLRGDWLENLGIGLDTLQDYNLDYFYEILTRFKNEDPDGNGTDDTVPWAAMDDPEYSDWVYAAYGYRVYELYEKDGMIMHGAAMPELKGALEFMRKLYKEGLIDPEFAISSDQLLREKLATAKYGGFYHNFPVSADETAAVSIGTISEGAIWESVPPPMGPDGKRGIMKDSPTSLLGRTTITSSCLYPDRAMELLDYICSDEGFYVTMFGIENEDYEINDQGTLTRIIDIPTIIGKGLVAYKSFPNNPSPELNEGTPRSLAKLSLGEKYGVIGLQLYTAAPSANEYNQVLKDIIKENYLKMIIGDEDIETMFEDFLKMYMQNGGEKLGKENYDIYMAQGN